jgi:hypothetical protein
MDDIHDFLRQFQFKHVETKMYYDPPSFDIHRAYGPSTDMEEFTRSCEVYTLTVKREAVERMMATYERYNRMVAAELYETSLRHRCPAAENAYNQYRMLLNLAK